MAASMAGVLLQAGDVRWCSQSSWVMIHRASYGAIGQSHDIEDQVKFVRRIEDRILDIFVLRSEGKLTKAKIKRNWDRKDWWLTADECLELGIVDSVRGAMAGIENR
jgi:ATP-dependent protease ClpP protease subunit